MDKISIIIPVYNVEGYLHQCIDSIINQTYNNLEILLINDGSTDSSLDICNEYASKDDRIIVLNKKNGGQSSARNMGLDIATGDFIGFVDSDDWVEPNMYETLLKGAKENEADIVACGVYNCDFKKGTRVPTVEGGGIVTYDNFYSYCDNLFVPCKFEIRFEIWNKIFKKEILEVVRFKEGQIYEEIFFMRNVLERTSKLVCIAIPLYDYRLCRPGSTVSSFKISRLSKIDEIDSFISLFAKQGQANLERKYVDYAMNAILELYLLAQRHHGSIDDKNALKTRFLKYLKYSEEMSMPIRTKFKVFYLSPTLYSFISRCLSVFRGL